MEPGRSFGFTPRFSSRAELVIVCLTMSGRCVSEIGQGEAHKRGVACGDEASSGGRGPGRQSSPDASPGRLMSLASLFLVCTGVALSGKS